MTYLGYVTWLYTKFLSGPRDFRNHSRSARGFSGDSHAILWRVQWNTVKLGSNKVISGQKRSFEVKKGQFRSKRVEKGLKRVEIFYKYFNSLWTSDESSFHFEANTVCFRSIYCTSKEMMTHRKLGENKIGFMTKPTLFDPFQYFPSYWYTKKYRPWKYRERSRTE